MMDRVFAFISSGCRDLDESLLLQTITLLGSGIGRSRRWNLTWSNVIYSGILVLLEIRCSGLMLQFQGWGHRSANFHNSPIYLYDLSPAYRIALTIAVQSDPVGLSHGIVGMKVQV